MPDDQLRVAAAAWCWATRSHLAQLQNQYLRDRCVGAVFAVA